MDETLEQKLATLKKQIFLQCCQGDLFVFAYGSLMWNPDFPYKNHEAACLYGYHRRLAIYSTVYRGTEAAPGLCFGLDKGGCCNGVVFEIIKNKQEQVITYLFEREMFADAYIPRYLTVKTAQGIKKKVLTFVVNRHTPKYAVPMPLEKIKDIISKGKGIGGTNLEYIDNSQKALMQMQVNSPKLNRLCQQLHKKG